MIPQTYLILASRTQTLHFGQHVIFPCPKVPFRNRLQQLQKKELDHGFNTQIPSTYTYGQNTPTILGTFALLVAWWDGEQQNRHQMAQNAHVAKTYAESQDSVHHKFDDYIRKRLDRLNRGHVIKELEDRRLGNITNKSKLHDKLYVLAMRGRGRDIGTDKDWTLYQNQEGYTHLEELLIYQPPKWRIQAREYVYLYGYIADQHTNPTNKGMRCHSFVLRLDDGVEKEYEVTMDTPIRVFFFHPDLSRLDRYDPLQFLLAYVPHDNREPFDPLFRLFNDLGIDKQVEELFRLKISPFDYFIEFRKHIVSYPMKGLKAIGEKAKVYRLPLIAELNFSRIVGQRFAKDIIIKKVIVHLKRRNNRRGLATSSSGPLSMVFAGPSGNGKTELAQELATLLNKPNDNNAFLKIDCGKLSTATELFGLAGAYQGSEQGSTLNNFIVSMSREPDKIGVVLLDEFDKVKKEVVTGLYQVLDRDKGEWTNKQLGDGSQTICLEDTYPFTEAFIGRISSFVPFLPLSSVVNPVKNVIECEMMTIAKNLIEREEANKEGKVKWSLDPKKKDSIAKLKVVEELIGEELDIQCLRNDGRISEGSTIHFSINEAVGRLAIRAIGHNDDRTDTSVDEEEEGKQHDEDFLS
ncbi:P-loop containing nucleoside triphosphate hydrolase protein [Fragilariopsis cylindrus CCMP1102]|uniref:p-loop containing nucleoside triphosphate hydrolase protein n=1 Tax=Fragilariopsis cylindrus CCMP1102 TaxID=635003 RepID=A0A1E7EZA1_9STRA|nr:P-loop containing nucleoside triphosphate hydrolase protein [Fragilariopsis cylindrus CCMP1102]|eukprot:OEU11328.1 P-loop containing nucleoside triphosphate hydrolase protein [Fragilariopsis cylindrus CCMP1102]